MKFSLMYLLRTVSGTIAAGFIAAAIVAAVAMTTRGVAYPSLWSTVVWLHVLFGVLWIGLLYYFNFVQVPAVADATEDGNPGPAAISKYVAPKALWWFRWAALGTWITGALALVFVGGFFNNFFALNGVTAIGFGAWLGTIMLFNVWVLIWPNQQKVLGLKPADDAEKARAKEIAFIASRTNTVLSIPMLMCMVAAGHGLPL